MSRISKAFFIILTGVFFTRAVLEVDAFGCDNTFFDAYDTYIHPDAGNPVTVTINAQTAHPIFDFNESVEVPYFSERIQTIFTPPDGRCSPPLFITYSSWRI